MIIDIEMEKNRTLTTEQVTMILDFAIEAAEDNGFINSYIFQRALHVFAAMILLPERKEEISAIIGNDVDIRLAWDALLQDGTIEQLIDKFANDMNYLGNIAEDWYKEYCEYAHSARGLLGIFTAFSQDAAQEAIARLKEVANSDFSSIVEIAENWGLNRNNSQNLDTMHQHLQDLNDGVIEPSENMPNFKVISNEEG